MPTGTCPVCEMEVRLNEIMPPMNLDPLETGEMFPCPNCGRALEVTSVNPLVLEEYVPPQEEEGQGA